jgi:hypothetical protein
VLIHLLYFHEQILVHHANHSSHVIMEEKRKRGWNSHVLAMEKEENKREMKKVVRVFDELVFFLSKRYLYVKEMGPPVMAHVSQVSR